MVRVIYLLSISDRRRRFQLIRSSVEGNIRKDEADEALADAEILLSKGSYRSALNRSYYAMYYAVLALLILSGKGTSKHSGGIAMFDLDFVKSGHFDKKFSKWLHQAFEDRLRSDYKVQVVIPPEDISENLKPRKGIC